VISAGAVTGFSLAALLGALWTCVAFLYDHAARRSIRSTAFYLAAGLVAAPLAWLTLADWSELAAGRPAGSHIPLAIFMCTLGALNFGLQVLVLHTMRVGHRPSVWTVSQSALVVPFIAAFLLWHEPLRAGEILAVVLILAGVALLGTLRDAGDSMYSSRWRGLALACFAGIGLMHVFNMVPSKVASLTDAASLRVPLSMSAYGVTAVIYGLAMKLRPRREEWLWGGLYGALTITAMQVMFKALDIMSPEKKAGVVIPLAVGLSIVCFSVLSRRRANAAPNHKRTGAILLVVLGMAVLVSVPFFKGS
jgi:multidrug transporter EmrE-like cation transporter